MMRNRANTGREAKYHGDAFETWGIGQLNAGVYLGIVAHYVHTEPPVKVTSRGIVYSGDGPADFNGVLEGGKAFAAEFKTVQGEYMQRSIVAPQQAEQLEATALAGGLALLVGEFRLEMVRVRFACPWLSVPWETKRTAESLSPGVVEPWLVTRYPDCFLKRWFATGPGPRKSTWDPLPKRVYPTE